MTNKIKRPGNLVSWENIQQFGHKVVLFDGKIRIVVNENLVLQVNEYWGVELGEQLESKATIQQSYYEIQRVYDVTGALIAERRNRNTNLLATSKGALKSVKLIEKNKIKSTVSESMKRKFREDDKKTKRKYAVHAQAIHSVTFDELTREAQKEIEVRLKKCGAKRVHFKELKNGNGVVVSATPKHIIMYLLI